MKPGTHRLLRESHRWLGLIAGIQLLLWTISGLYFTIVPIETIRGNHLLTQPAETALITHYDVLSPSALARRDAALSELNLSDIALTYRLDRPVYLMAGRVIDAESGDELPNLTADEASQIVARRTGLSTRTPVLLTEVAKNHEFRGGPMPIWQIQTGAENARFYVDPQSGRIRAVRTDAWRWFDFLWTLHIMDYETRDNFNHFLVQFLSILGLLTVLSGLVLFATTQLIRRTHRAGEG